VFFFFWGVVVGFGVWWVFLVCFVGFFVVGGGVGWCGCFGFCLVCLGCWLVGCFVGFLDLFFWFFGDEWAKGEWDERVRMERLGRYGQVGEEKSGR